MRRPHVHLALAGENQITNLLPLLHLMETDPPDELWLAVGVRDPGDAAERARSVKPAERFAGLVRRRWNVPVRRIVGPPDRPGPLVRMVEELLAERRPARVSANLTQGTRPMLLGVLAALQQAEREAGTELRAFLYLARPSRLLWMHPHVDEGIEDLRVEVDLGDVLALRGPVEHHRAGRRQGEEQARARRAFVLGLVGLLDPGAASAAFEEGVRRLHGSLQHLADPVPPDLPVRLPLATLPARQRELLAAVAALPQPAGAEVLRREGDDLVLAGAEALRLLRGGWFEEWLFLLAEEAFAGRPEARAHLRLCLRGDAAAAGADGEIDLALLVEGEIHVVEAKAGRIGADPGAGLDRRTLQALTHWRHVLLGPRGRIAVVSLQRPEDPRAAEILEREAAISRIDLFFGRAGIDAFRAWLEGL